MGDHPGDDYDFDLDSSVGDEAAPASDPEPAPDDEHRAKTHVRFKPSKKVEDFSLDDEDDDGVDPDDPWATFTGVVKAPTHFDRINEAQIVLGILHGFLSSSRQLEELRDDVSSVAERIAVLAGMNENAGEYDSIRDEVDQTLEHLEERIVEIERRVPAGWLRRRFDDHELDEGTLAHFLRFQLQHLDATPECWSRIDLVITRLARRKLREDHYVPREPERLVELWSDILPPSTIEAHVRSAAVKFFDNATRRLEEFTEAEEIFTSGYYVDVAGYKISLRLNYFDPPVLYAAAKTNIALHNWLEAQEAAGRNVGALGRHFAHAHEQIRLIFSRQGQDFEALARFRARMFGKDEPEPEKPPDHGGAEWKEPLETPKGTFRKIAFLIAFGVAVAAAAPVVASLWGQNKRDLEQQPHAASFHPMLIKASLGGDPPSLLVGEIDSSRWVMLNPQEKRAEVGLLLSSLRSRDLESALIYREGVLAIHIVGGQVRFIE